MEFLGFKIDTLTKTLTLTKEKLEQVVLKFLNLLSCPLSDYCFGIIKLIGLIS